MLVSSCRCRPSHLPGEIEHLSGVWFIHSSRPRGGERCVHLELVDGSPLPVAYETGTCPREIYRGMLDLDPPNEERRPLYVVQAFLRSQCDPTGTLPIDRAEAVRDFGEWSVVSGTVWFRSDNLPGYFVPIEPTSAAEQGPLLTLQFDGRLYTFRRTQLF